MTWSGKKTRGAPHTCMVVTPPADTHASLVWRRQMEGTRGNSCRVSSNTSCRYLHRLSSNSLSTFQWMMSVVLLTCLFMQQFSLAPANRLSNLTASLFTDSATDEVWVQERMGSARHETRQADRLVILQRDASGEGIDPSCSLFADPQVIRQLLSLSQQSQQRRHVSKHDMAHLIKYCQQESSLAAFPSNSELQLLKGGVQSWHEVQAEQQLLRSTQYAGLLIFPGTKWCGAGDIHSRS